MKLSTWRSNHLERERASIDQQWKYRLDQLRLLNEAELFEDSRSQLERIEKREDNRAEIVSWLSGHVTNVLSERAGVPITGFLQEEIEAVVDHFLYSEFTFEVLCDRIYEEVILAHFDSIQCDEADDHKNAPSVTISQNRANIEELWAHGQEARLS